MTPVRATGLLALFFLLACGRAEEPAESPLKRDAIEVRRIDVEELSPAETFGLIVQRLVAVGRDSLLVLESRPPRVVLWEPEGGAHVLNQEGPGPRELSAPHYTLSRLSRPSPPLPAGAVILHATGGQDNLVVWPPGLDLRLRSERGVCSVASLQNALVASFYTSADRAGGQVFGGSLRLGTLRWQIDHEKVWHWQTQDSWDPFDYGPDPALNLARSAYTRILPHGARSFFRIECVGSDSVTVFEGPRRLFAFSVDPGHGSAAAKAASSEAPSSTLSSRRVLQDADVDASFRLHALFPAHRNDDSPSGFEQEIRVYTSRGELVERYTIARALAAFAIAPFGKGWFGIDAESSSLLRLSPAPSPPTPVEVAP